MMIPTIMTMTVMEFSMSMMLVWTVKSTGQLISTMIGTKMAAMICLKTMMMTMMENLMERMNVRKDAPIGKLNELQPPILIWMVVMMQPKTWTMTMIT